MQKASKRTGLVWSILLLIAWIILEIMYQLTRNHQGSRMNRKQDFLKVVVIIAATSATSGDREVYSPVFTVVFRGYEYRVR